MYRIVIRIFDLSAQHVQSESLRFSYPPDPFAPEIQKIPQFEFHCSSARFPRSEAEEMSEAGAQHLPDNGAKRSG
jgi:hypothetical protein